MVRRGVNLERKELPDGFLGAHKREAKRKRSEKFVQVATDKSVNYKSGKKIPANHIDSVEKKFRKQKIKPVREETLIEKSIEEKKPEVNESLIEEINNLGKRITNITTEIDDNYYKKPFLSSFHSEELEHFKERGYSILDSLNKPEKKNGKEIEKIILSLEHYLAEGTLLLNGLRRIYKSQVEDREIGGEKNHFEEELADPKQLDADINRNLSPVYSKEETPADALEYKQKYGRRMRPPVSDTEVIEELPSKIVNDGEINKPTEEETEVPEKIGQEFPGADNQETLENEKLSDEIKFAIESYLKTAKEMLNVVRNSGFFNFENEDDQKKYIQKYVEVAVSKHEKDTESEKKLIVENVIKELFKK